MNLLPSAHKARNLCFERAITTTTSRLQEQNVRSALNASLLGELVIGQIEQAVTTAFLPNIRHGAIDIPKEYRATEACMLLPLTTKRSLNQSPPISIAAAMPTPGQYTRAIEELQRQGYRRDLAHLHADLLIRGTFQRKLYMSKLGSLASADCTTKITAHNGIQIIGRPLVRFDAASKDGLTNPIQTPNSTTSCLGHEFLHVVDNLNRQPRDKNGDAERAYKEARGYYFSHVYLTAAEPILFPFDEPVSNVERARREHATAQEPFPRSPQFIDALTQLGVI